MAASGSGSVSITLDLQRDLSLSSGEMQSIKFVETPEALATFKAKDSAATILRRRLSSEFRTWIDALPARVLPQGRVILHTAALSDIVHQVFDIAQLPEGPERNWLQADCIDLAKAFADLMDVPYLRLRFDVIDDNACRKFHTDAIFARLICTYRGTGTQYGFSPQGKDPTEIYTVQAGSPILLRGTRWPEDPKSGLKHRSPPIEGSGETRFVFVVDPIYNPDDEI